MRLHGTLWPSRVTTSPVSGPGQLSSTALAIKADALPAPTTMVRPFGGGGRYAGTRSNGDAAFMAASNIARSTARGSLIIPCCLGLAAEEPSVAGSRCPGVKVSVVRNPQGFADRIGHLLRGRFTSEIGRMQSWVRSYPLHSPHQPPGGLLLSQMLQHHRGCPEGRDRVGHPLAGDVKGR